MSSIALRSGVFVRLWTGYLAALRARPIRTRMISSGMLCFIGDSVAQFGIEGKKMILPASDVPEQERWDPMRTARLCFYGSIIFAPLGHVYLGMMDKVQLGGRIRTILGRVTIDSLLWSPFVCALFPTALGLMEMKSLPEIKRKLEMVWWPTWMRAVCVFGPTQIVNFAFVPAQHRLLLLQCVALCWNIYLSWVNGTTNRRLALIETGKKAADQAESIKSSPANEKTRRLQSTL